MHFLDHGLAGHFFVRDISAVLKVRIFQDLEMRVEEEIKLENISAQEARYVLKKEDDERRKWSLYLHGTDIQNPSFCDVVLNGGDTTVDHAIVTIVSSATPSCSKTIPESRTRIGDLTLATQARAALLEFPSAGISARDEEIFVGLKAPLAQKKIIVPNIENALSVFNRAVMFPDNRSNGRKGSCCCGRLYPLLPAVGGLDKDIVLTYEDVLSDDQPPYKNAVIVGGGPTGLEIAVHLAEYGCSITVVEMLSKIGRGLEAMTKKILLQKLKENSVQVMTETKLSCIEDNGVTVTDRDGMELFMEAEKVIIAIGTRPDNALYEKIKSLGCEIPQIGDCLEPRTAKVAILESAVLGRKI